MRDDTDTRRLVAAAATRYGITREHTTQLVKASRELRRWYEGECGDSGPFGSWAIERDEATGKPYHVFYPHTGTTVTRTPIKDRETSAMRRIDAILLHYPGVLPYYQTDPRGACLYLYRLAELPPGANVQSCYNVGLCMDA